MSYRVIAGTKRNTVEIMYRPFVCEKTKVADLSCSTEYVIFDSAIPSKPYHLKNNPMFNGLDCAPAKQTNVYIFSPTLGDSLSIVLYDSKEDYMSWHKKKALKSIPVGESKKLYRFGEWTVSNAACIRYQW